MESLENVIAHFFKLMGRVPDVFIIDMDEVVRKAVKAMQVKYREVSKKTFGRWQWL